MDESPPYQAGLAGRKARLGDESVNNSLAPRGRPAMGIAGICLKAGWQSSAWQSCQDVLPSFPSIFSRRGCLMVVSVSAIIR